MTIRSRRPALVLVAGLLLATALSPGTAPGSTVPAARERLRPGAGACGVLTEIVLDSGVVACTHGPDPAPEGIDISEPFDPARARTGLILPDPPTGRASAEAAGPGRVRCYGDGRGGPRVHAIYAHPSDRPDRYNQVVDSIRRFAAETDAVFDSSAGLYGADRHIRFVTDGQCRLVVDKVTLSARGDDNLETTMSELAARGYDEPDRKYLVWMDSTMLCGIAAYYLDDSASAANANNGPAGVPGVVARVDSGCWGLADRGESIEAHEIMHSLGSVLPSAPNSTAAGHCRDESDRMCYSDGTAVTLFDVCGTNSEALFDCRGDDYFNPSPPAGSYLAQNWNTARSAFLASAEGDSTISISDASVLERDSGTRDAVFTVALKFPVGEGVSVRWATAADTATPGKDYLSRNGLVSFPPGTTRVAIRVPVLGDTLDEANERFRVNLSNPLGGPIADGQGIGRITDDDPKRHGYRLVATDGGIFAFGDAPFYGSTGDIRLNRPINGMAATPSGRGYWMVASDGGIFAFGDAGFFGSTGDVNLAEPVVGIATTASGRGYWMATSRGEVFNFGDAVPYGSMAGRPPQPIVGMATSAAGGYWMVGRDGKVTNFGNAPDLGSTPPLNRPVVAIAASPDGGGYWVTTSGGDVFSFGNAGFFGSTSDIALSKPITGIAPTATGEGYWLVASDGGIFAFGDATFLGSMGGVPLNQPVVGMTTVR